MAFPEPTEVAPWYLRNINQALELDETTGNVFVRTARSPGYRPNKPLAHLLDKTGHASAQRAARTVHSKPRCLCVNGSAERGRKRLGQQAQ